MKKEDILKQIIAQQEDLIANLQKSAERYENSSDLDENDTVDYDDLSRQNEAKDMQHRVENLLPPAQAALATIKGYQDQNFEEFTIGALAETDKNYLFCGVALPAFPAGDKEVICFSADAPIYKIMEGKKQGDQVKIGDTNHKILFIS